MKIQQWTASAHLRPGDKKYVHPTTFNMVYF